MSLPRFLTGLRRVERCAGGVGGVTPHVSGAEWKDLAGYNRTSRLRAQHITDTVKNIQTNLGSGKTASLQVFQAYSRQTLFHYDTLREAHIQEAGWRFYTYIRQQKTSTRLL
ncbi:hypothetical protein DFS34DRAFT_593707 [Phlyctochytrium arcticum]|nr:hypothetical protein DFS34DRAFT_593707 [Phlyctochytrium arcticum]